ncbi:3-oxo-5a-steroid 4- dehydrogenase [Puttea exsequens]|nr:3-oxo-5a-steroid 4- dehydrogenase [Puttea exsequens]
MAPSQLTLAVRPRGRPLQKLPEEVSVPTDSPASEIYTQLAQQSGASIHRLRVTKGSDGTLVPNNKAIKLEDTGLRDASTVYVKDLGPQIPWRTVFLIEYLGPLLIHPLLFLILPPTATTTLLTPFENSFMPAFRSPLQTLSLILITIHFLKRELETLFIHRFSAATMPAFNIFKNSAHYWLLSGLNMAYWIYRPSAPAAQPSNPLITALGLTLFAFGELANLNTHLVLRDLRSTGGTERGIPQGFGFGAVTCPNYMFEAVAWVGVALMSWSWSTVLFAVVAVGQMGVWAKKKEGRYRREFGSNYQKKRYGMLPGIW